MVESVFAKYTPKVYKHVWTATLVVDELHGGTPTDRNQIRGWIKKNLGEKNPDKLSDMVAETMVELGLSEDEAIEKVAGTVGRSAFKRSESGELFIEGRQVKACLKEAASVAVQAKTLKQEGWGKTGKHLTNFFNEHFFVLEDRIGLGVTEPSGVHERFVQTPRFGSAYKSEEFVSDAKVTLTVASDFVWPKDFWPIVWTVAEKIGLGASRSMGFGQFKVVDWTKQ